MLRSHTWRTAANSAGYLLDELKPAARVLDIGCGPGTITADLAALVPDGHVTALDPATGVLAQARETAAGRGLDNVTFGTGDVHALEYPDGAFDAVHAHQVLQHVGDPVRALREMRRVCAPGGVVAARDADYAAMFWYPAVDGLTGWLELYRRVARANGGEPDAGRRLHAWAREAGLRDVTASSTTWCFASAEDRAWWSESWAERTLASSFAASAVDGGHATREQLRAAADAWLEWGAREDAWFAVPHGEILCRA
ncbi:ubiquinone biosynthesis methyltransferase UbiE [Streptomyces abyssalis]|uniref:Ubiquinone biosynthesis methyltransferase UbiE n=1 Tax=Streptomyces abyssalis TaxID=933944 RepID=A0A1E7JS54_9ACTN|nr:ubiquinone biosynthesis methyltransferase UbiE [Streptomyces abyssalis]OEU94152.1 ubiquinone biosynthesis methyltransferase UbiE [Streptomyces abyssalis]OEV26644.1 ubiquinone biosynthesis methyltransferase UbiE [Streptomyces nanshensis]